MAPIRLSLISGGSILLEGYVDPVDLMETGGESTSGWWTTSPAARPSGCPTSTTG